MTGTVVSHFEVTHGQYTRVQVDGNNKASLLRFVDLPWNSLPLGSKVTISVQPIPTQTKETDSNA